ncbi:heme A synthase [Gulosibacter molinativorax]|uniref:Heme A synthase n=2 Tax=Gulosibacter molinativorax TaxID=256821 RepID=A0ABT7C7H2_9MICO|nr:heme A synthase [Gulosibacter molinativorax]
MPDHVTAWTRVIAWINLVVNIIIVGTGGLVRLTGSGLGCPTWPLCTEDSLVPTREMGIHGIIEFGNRTLTGVVVVAALLTFLAVLNTRRSRMGLVGPSVWVGALIIVQAVVGGITVLVDLDPRIVGVHFLFSALIVAIAALLLQRVRLAEPLPARGPTKGAPALWGSAVAVGILTWITEIVGVLTTGAGPHAGDTIAARNGLDPVIMQHVHAWPGYALVVSLVVFLVIVFRGDYPRTRPISVSLTLAVLLQIGIGVFQARTGLPIWSVATHMVLAVVVIAILSVTLVNARRDSAARLTREDGKNGAGTVHLPVASV